MGVTTGEDGKLHYTNQSNYRYVKYESYDDWYDNGPGSESFKRSLNKASETVKRWPAWKRSLFGKRKIEPEPKEYITDEDLEIDV